MKIKQAQGKKIIELNGKIGSPYSIVSIIVLVLMLLLCFLLVYIFQNRPVVAMATIFIPLVIAVFLVKIVIWNLFGTETLIFSKTDMRAFYDYKYIYQKQIKHYNFSNISCLFFSNKNTTPQSIAEYKEAAKGLYKLHFLMDEDILQTSFSLTGKELSEVKKIMT